MSLHLCCPEQEEPSQVTGPSLWNRKKCLPDSKAGRLEILVFVALFRHRVQQYEMHRVPRRECARLGENVPYDKVHRSNPKHLYPKLNGYGDNGERIVWSSCCSTYCTCFACCYPYTAHVRPSASQPSQAHSAFIINRCHSYSEL